MGSFAAALQSLHAPSTTAAAATPSPALVGDETRGENATATQDEDRADVEAWSAFIGEHLATFDRAVVSPFLFLCSKVDSKFLIICMPLGSFFFRQSFQEFIATARSSLNALQSFR